MTFSLLKTESSECQGFLEELETLSTVVMFDSYIQNNISLSCRGMKLEKQHIL